MKRLLPLVAMLCLAGCEDLGLEDPVPTDQTAAPTTASSSLSQPPAAALMPAPSADQAAPAESSGTETAMAAPPPPPPGDRTCADFLFYKDGQSGVSSVIADPFTIATSADGSGEPLEIHDASLDMGVQGGMSVRIADKVFITVDQPAPRYEVYYISAGENPIKLQVFGADGKLEQTHILSAFPQKQLLMQPVASQQGLRAIVLTDPDKTGLLTKVCAVK